MASKDKDSNWFKKHKILTGILALFVIGVFSTAINGNKDNGGVEKSVATSSEEEQQQTEFKIGETAKFDNKSITVTKVQRNYQTGNQYAQPESGMEFVVVTVKITNDSDSTLDYSSYEFKMQDSDGVQQNEAFTAITQGKLHNGSLAKGGKVTGKLAYEVPRGDKGLKLLYQNFSLFDNEVITFNLK